MRGEHPKGSLAGRLSVAILQKKKTDSRDTDVVEVESEQLLVSTFQAVESLPPNIYLIITSSTSTNQKLLNSTNALIRKRCHLIRIHVMIPVLQGHSVITGTSYYPTHIRDTSLFTERTAQYVTQGKWRSGGRQGQACKSLGSGDRSRCSGFCPLGHFVAQKSWVCLPLLPKSHG